MHSRIFQLETERVDNNCRMCSSDIPDWFTQQIADYINDDTDRDSDIKWLSDHLGPLVSRVGDEIEFVNDPKEYFTAKYEIFKECAARLSNITLDEFVSGDPRSKVFLDIYMLDNAFDSKYSFYIYECDELCTLSSWLRSVKKGDVYYVGGTVDYHC